MHYPGDKNQNEFQEEIHRLLEASRVSGGRLRADLSGFVFDVPFSVIDDPYNVDCRGAIFKSGVHLSGPSGTYNFSDAKFYTAARFDDVRHGTLNCTKAEFAKDVVCEDLKCGASFDRAVFKGKVLFDRCRFFGTTSFSCSVFHHDVTFSLTDFVAMAANPGDQPAIADFSGAVFRTPDRVRWFRLNRRTAPLRIRLTNCDIQPMSFVDVNWARDRERLILQDEIDARASGYFEGDETYYAPTRFDLVAMLYRQLATGFEKARAHDLAEECVAGAWEMKRRDPGLTRTDRVAIAVYSLASRYGTSVARSVAVWTLVVCLAFPLILSLPLSGASPASDNVFSMPIRRNHIHTVLETAASHYYLVAIDNAQVVSVAVSRPLLLSIETATFARNPAFVAKTVCGRLLLALETGLSAGQLALVLLALRRRFKQ